MSYRRQHELGLAQARQKHDRAIRLYEFIVHYYAEHGYAPSFGEMIPAAGTTTKSMVAFYLGVLVEWEWIAHEKHGDRAIQLIRPAERGLSAQQLAERLGLTQKPLHYPVQMLPRMRRRVSKPKSKQVATQVIIKQQIRPFDG